MCLKALIVKHIIEECTKYTATRMDFNMLLNIAESLK